MKKYNGERASHVWQWWSQRGSDSPCHGLTMRLVVYTQLSSCSVEQVFSLLTSIREACGDSLLCHWLVTAITTTKYEKASP